MGDAAGGFGTVAAPSGATTEAEPRAGVWVRGIEGEAGRPLEDGTAPGRGCSAPPAERRTGVAVNRRPQETQLAASSEFAAPQCGQDLGT